MYQKKPQPPPRGTNADGSLNVMLELQQPAGSSTNVASLVRKLPGCALDDSYEPVPMANGTVIVRCRIDRKSRIEELKRETGVANVWPDTPIAPMTPR